MAAEDVQLKNLTQHQNSVQDPLGGIPVLFNSFGAALVISVGRVFPAWAGRIPLRYNS